MQKRHFYGTVTAVAAAGLLGFGDAVSADPIAPGNPISGWTFDGQLEDAFGDNDGAAPNGMDYVTDGPFGGEALDLTGNTQTGDENDPQRHVNIGNPASLQLTTNMTVATWVRTGSGGEHQYALAKSDDDNQNQWAINTRYSSKRLEVYVSENGTDTQTARPHNDLYNLADDQWHHVAFSLDEEDGLSVYIDGVKATDWTTDTAISNGVTQLHNGSADIIVGALSDLDASSFFQGHIGETAIWGEVLSDDEIAWLAENSISAIPEPGSLGLLGTGAAMMFFRRRK